MRKFRKHAGVVAAALALSLVAIACGGEGDGTDGGLTGSITISGSSTVEPISSVVAEIFNEELGPDVAISVDGPGTGDGFELFCNGETDISDASRPIEEDEVKLCEKNGVEYTELEVALDGLTVMTSPDNASVTCLNDGDLYALFGPESEGIDTWAGADSLATEVGGNGGFPDAPLEITAPGAESGTYDSFLEIVTGDISEARAESGAISEDQVETARPDYASQADDTAIIAAMEASDTPLGWVGFAFAEEAGDAIKELAVSAEPGGECIEPTSETIADGSYPISRSLYIYVNADAAEENAAVAGYVDYYLSDEGIASVAEVGYVDLPADQLDATRATWDARTVGSTAG